MSTAVATSMVDHSPKDGTGDAIDGSEVDENPNTLAAILDGSTATDLGGAAAVDCLALRVIDLDNATGAVQVNMNVEWDPADGANMTDNSSGVGVGFKMPDSADAQETFARLDVMCVDDTASAEKGEFSFKVQNASGTLTEVMTFQSGLTTTGTILNLSTGETTVVDGDVLGRIEFQAPAETGADAILVSAAIWAEADATFDATTNTTDLVFANGTSEAATAKLRLTPAALTPHSNDLITLGTTALGFADLHLATGGVINWANGEVTLTGATDTLTLAGATTLALGAVATISHSGVLAVTTVGALTLTPSTGVVISAGKTLGVGTTVGANQYMNVSGDAGSGSVLRLISSNSSTPQGLYISFSAASPDNNTQTFLNFEDATAGRFVVWADGDVVNHDNSYGAISDVQLKQDVSYVGPYAGQDVVDGDGSYVALMKKFRPAKYRFKTDVAADKNAKQMLGFSAQDVLAFAPGLVIGKGTETEPYGLQYSLINMQMVIAVQELIQRVEALEA